MASVLVLQSFFRGREDRLLYFYNLFAVCVLSPFFARAMPSVDQPSVIAALPGHAHLFFYRCSFV